MASFTSSVKYVAVLLFAITISVFFMETEAKRGCSSFGHSCFGGHGKRSEGGDLSAGLRGLGSDNGAMVQQQDGGHLLGQEEVAAPRPVYPPTIRDLLNAGDDIIPIRNGGFQDSSDDSQSQVNNDLKIHLTPFLRHWLLEFRKAQQQQNQDGYNAYNNLI